MGMAVPPGKEVVLSKKQKELVHRKDIMALQDHMMSLPPDLLRNIPDMTTDWFGPGIYLRMYWLPTGDIAIGKIHKTEHFNILCRGKVSVSTPDGPVIFDATERPVVFLSKPGVKKAIYCIEECFWITTHVTDETDREKLEDELIAKDFAQLEHQE
jgi:hypothetical protein